MGANGKASGRVEHDESCPQQECRGEINSTLQLAKHTVVHSILESDQMPLMMNMVGAILAISCGSNSLRLTMVVKRDGKQHRYVNQ